MAAPQTASLSGIWMPSEPVTTSPSQPLTPPLRHRALKPRFFKRGHPHKFAMRLVIDKLLIIVLFYARKRK
jgi:hypothetical protein